MPRQKTPAPIRRTTLREELHEALNRQTVVIAERGLNSIDELKKRAIAKAAEHGITEIDELADHLSHQLKRALIAGLSK